MTKPTAGGRGSWLRRLLAPPVFDDEDRTSTARMNHMMALTIALIGSVVVLVLAVVSPLQEARWLAVAVGIDGMCLVVIAVNRRGHVLVAGWVQTLAAWALFTLTAITSGGVYAPSIGLQLVVVVLAAMLLGRRAGFAVAALSVATVVGMAAAQEAGVLGAGDAVRPPLATSVTLSGAIVATVLLQGLIAGNLRSVRDRALKELAERRAAELFAETLIDSAPGVFFTLDAQGRFVRWNRRTEALIGATAEQLRGTPALGIVHEDDRALVAAKLTEVFETGHAAIEARILTRAGPRDHLLTGYRLEVDGAPVLIGFGVDVTDRKILEEEMRALSLHDALTGLYNRRGLGTLAEQQLRIARRTGKELAVAFIDLDGLKRLNDEHGHAAGDQALCIVAQALRTSFRDADVVARLGGDEFAVLAVEPGTLDEDTLAARLEVALADGAAAAGAPRAVAISLGLARFDPAQPEPLEDLLARADAAMYRRKVRPADPPWQRPPVAAPMRDR